MHLKVIGLHAQYTLIILDLIVNMIGGGGDLYDHFISTGMVTMIIMHKIFI